jgi:serine/threonine-protein kinase
MQDLIGKTLGNYKILEEIGQGGMAQVFKAYQPGLERHVAVKVLSSALAADSNFATRFQREARSIANLQHPHVVQVYDSGVQDHYYYLVMQYVADSTTLADLMGEQHPPEQLIEYLTQVADALDYAHKQGIVHRDVKPSNILIDHRWGALLADFGLVKIAESGNDLTRTGVRMGTPTYMAPEQALGEQTGPYTDIYALGVILYQILTGKIPHDAPSPQGILTRRTIEPVPSPRRINPTISPNFEQIILRSLAMNPTNRYKTAADLKRAIITAQKVSDDQPNRTIKDTLTQIGALPFPVSAKRKIWWLIGGVVAAVIIGIVFIIYQLSPIDRGGQRSSGQIEETASLSEINPPTPIPTPTLPPLDDSRVILKAELAVLAGPSLEEQILYYLPAGANVEMIGRDRSGEWWQIRTSRGEGWLEANPSSAEVTDLGNVPIIAILTPTSPAPETSTPIATPTLTPTSAPPSPTATVTDIAQPTVTAQPTPTFTIVPPPTNTPAPAATPTSGLTAVELLTPQLVGYNGASFSWKWEGQSGIKQVDWYFDIKIFKGAALEPYNVLVAEPEQTRYSDGLWSFDGTPDFQCGSYWVVQIAKRHPDGTYAGSLSAESDRLPIGSACGSGGGGDGGGGGGLTGG